MGTAGWVTVGLGGWLLAGFGVALAFGRAAKDDPAAQRHEPEGRRLLRRRQLQQAQQHIAETGVAEREAGVPSPAQSGQRDVTATSVTSTANQ
jgi:hypothetical protein